MKPVHLFTVDHRYPSRTEGGGCVQSLVVGVDCQSPGPSYADMCAQYHIWPCWPEYQIVGFQGYRKHLDFRPGVTVKGDWVAVTVPEFKEYQAWQKHSGAYNVQLLLKDCDMLTNPPFDVSYNTNIGEDFSLSASAKDWGALVAVMKKYGDFDFGITTVTSYCNLVTTGQVFNRWMEFWWQVVNDMQFKMEESCSDPGPRPDIYLPRRMAFLSERIFSIWLNSAGLKVKPLPLLVCWEYS